MTKQVLVVAAHPDDEVLGCGGTMARHAAEGDEIHVIFMSDGVGARYKNHHDECQRRVNNSKEACSLLGVKSVHYLDFPDNKMDSLPLLDIVQKLEGLMERVQPHIVYTHHAGDLNIDHRLTHQAVMTACRPVPKNTACQLYTFEILSSTEWQTSDRAPFIPNMFVDIDDYIEKKMQALQAYEDEMRESPHSRSMENARRLSAYRGNSVGIKNAEAFMVARLVR